MKDISALHQAEYDTPPESVAYAPGVVKLLGEHMVSAGGLVLAAAIACEMRVAVSLRKDSSLRFFAADLGERKRATSGSLKYKREDRWANHLKSVYDAYSSIGFEGRGVNVTISGDIPSGLSLGISSALAMATAMAFKGLFSQNWKNEDMADTVCRAESKFWEKSFPIYNYLAATAPGANTLSVIDLRNSRRRAVQFLDGEWALVLTDSRVPRISIDAEIREKEEQLQKCLAPASMAHFRNLRDVAVHEMDDLMGLIPEGIRRRCLHIVEEIARVGELEDALARHDDAGFGRILNKSHNSLRSLYEISCPEIDWLVKRALEIEGVLCSRMTGKGFGGCTVSIMKPAAILEYRKRIEDYERIFGFKAQIYETSVNGGLRVETM